MRKRVKPIKEAARSVDALADRLLVLATNPDEAGKFAYRALRAGIKEAAKDASTTQAEKSEILDALIQLAGIILV
jgi:hypothetical protein